MGSLVILTGFFVHICIGAGLAVVFLAAKLARDLHAKSPRRLVPIAVHTCATLFALAVFVFTMIFVGGYQPHSWLNLAALAFAFLAAVSTGWRFARLLRAG